MKSTPNSVTGSSRIALDLAAGGCVDRADAPRARRREGYPRALSGDGIPLEGRIAAIGDVFDALTTDRIYRKALDLPMALQILRDGRGTQFDAAMLDVFFDSLDEMLAIKEASDGVPPGRQESP